MFESPGPTNRLVFSKNQLSEPSEPARAGDVVFCVGPHKIVVPTLTHYVCLLLYSKFSHTSSQCGSFGSFSIDPCMEDYFVETKYCHRHQF